MVVLMSNDSPQGRWVMNEARIAKELANQRGLTERVTKAFEDVLISEPSSDASENEIRILQNILSLLRAHLAIMQDERNVQSAITAFHSDVVSMAHLRQDRSAG
jgi:hypothetical protein